MQNYANLSEFNFVSNPLTTNPKMQEHKNSRRNDSYIEETVNRLMIFDSQEIILKITLIQT